MWVRIPSLKMLLTYSLILFFPQLKLSLNIGEKLIKFDGIPSIKNVLILVISLDFFLNSPSPQLYLINRLTFFSSQKWRFNKIDHAKIFIQIILDWCPGQDYPPFRLNLWHSHINLTLWILDNVTFIANLLEEIIIKRFFWWNFLLYSPPGQVHPVSIFQSHLSNCQFWLPVVAAVSWCYHQNPP